MLRVLATNLGVEYLRRAYERRLLLHGSLLYREMGCRCESDREESAVALFRRESLRRCRSLLSSDRQWLASRRGSLPEISREPIRSCTYRECNPGRESPAQVTRYRRARRLSDKKLPASCSASRIRP